MEEVACIIPDCCGWLERSLRIQVCSYRWLLAAWNSSAPPLWTSLSIYASESSVVVSLCFRDFRHAGQQGLWAISDALAISIIVSGIPAHDARSRNLLDPGICSNQWFEILVQKWAPGWDGGINNSIVQYSGKSFDIVISSLESVAAYLFSYALHLEIRVLSLGNLFSFYTLIRTYLWKWYAVTLCNQYSFPVWPMVWPTPVLYCLRLTKMLYCMARFGVILPFCLYRIAKISEIPVLYCTISRTARFLILGICLAIRSLTGI